MTNPNFSNKSFEVLFQILFAGAREKKQTLQENEKMAGVIMKRERKRKFEFWEKKNIIFMSYKRQREREKER
mgnify:CR=1 FL=1